MSIFFSTSVEVLSASGAVLIVDAADVDRQIHTNEHSTNMWIGFDNTVAPDAGYPISTGTQASLKDEFVLPAGHQLWAASGSATGRISVLVTAIAR